MKPRQVRVLVLEKEGPCRNTLIRKLEGPGCAVVNCFPQGPWHQERFCEQTNVFDPSMSNTMGIDILNALGQYIPMVLTAILPELAVETFDPEVVNYVLIPITTFQPKRALRLINNRPAPASPGATPAPKRYPVRAGDGVVLVDLRRTTHFEVEQEVVWAHASGRLRTFWKSLGEVEAAFPGSDLLRIHRHLLVRLEAVLGMKPAGGGRAMVKLAGGIEIEASRGGAPRLMAYFGLGSPRFSREHPERQAWKDDGNSDPGE